MGKLENSIVLWDGRQWRVRILYLFRQNAGRQALNCFFVFSPKDIHILQQYFGRWK